MARKKKNVMIRNVYKGALFLGAGSRVEPGEVRDCDAGIAEELARRGMVEIWLEEPEKEQLEVDIDTLVDRSGYFTGGDGGDGGDGGGDAA